VTPVHWYQASTPLKAMIDRLVCADGGNPDPTRTRGKDAQKAKEIELNGYEYPRHLKGRLYSVIVHGDVEGTEMVQNELVNWLTFMQLEAAGPKAILNRYIGYWEPYSTSHESLDEDVAMMGEVRNAAATLCEAVKAKRDGKMLAAGQALVEPRMK
jgi:multimeric flavodoxin WrbA